MKVSSKQIYQLGRAAFQHAIRFDGDFIQPGLLDDNAALDVLYEDYLNSLPPAAQIERMISHAFDAIHAALCDEAAQAAISTPARRVLSAVHTHLTRQWLQPANVHTPDVAQQRRDVERAMKAIGTHLDARKDEARARADARFRARLLVQERVFLTVIRATIRRRAYPVDVSKPQQKRAA